MIMDSSHVATCVSTSGSTAASKGRKKRQGASKKRQGAPKKRKGPPKKPKKTPKPAFTLSGTCFTYKSYFVLLNKFNYFQKAILL